MMSEPLKAILQLVRENLKVTWIIPEELEQPHGFQYLLPTSELESRVKACRDALGSLQSVADAPSDSSLAKALQQLARSGHELYELLMSGSGGNAQGAMAFRDWFERHIATADAGTWRIEFQYQGAQPVVIPWGLMYSSTGDAPAGVDYKDYVDFWAHRYSTVSYIQAANVRDSKSSEITINGKAILCSLLIEDSADNMELEAQAQAPENLRMRVWGPLHDHTIGTVRDLSDRFRGKLELHHIVYLNLRVDAGGNTVPDGKATQKRLAAISSYLNVNHKHGIVMIDREAIIRGDRGKAWLDMFFNAYWAGVIAAETDITSKRLRHHGFRFLTELLACDKKLSQSLPEIQKQLWPFSLLYGVYSNPENVFVTPPPEIVKEMRAVLEQREQGHVPS